MKKYQYQINDRVLAFDKGDYIIPGTITAMHDSLYRIEYDCGGYDYLIYAEIRPLEYNVRDYVESLIGIGIVKSIDPEWGLLTVSYGKEYNVECYYENELKPALKPSFCTRIFKQGVYLFD